eukprot:840516-Amphidinium_carterae.2
MFAEGRVQHLLPLCCISEKLQLSLVLSDGVGQLRCLDDNGESTSHMMTFTRKQALRPDASSPKSIRRAHCRDSRSRSQHSIMARGAGCKSNLSGGSKDDLGLPMDINHNKSKHRSHRVSKHM